ncbi:MAG: tetratricopeptide repeat protein [Xanthomonadaceae bacterium]|jgi:tetratricopeptide (TPR) repeat protein|nr:tetratricopeptide repeat protein [Xanthomonadaceae bacterium]
MCVIRYSPKLVWVLLPLALVLVGCATTSDSREVRSPAFDRLMAAGDTQLANGAFDAALSTYKEAAQADPTRKEPWVRSAQLYFDSGNYGRAIAAAEEVLQRDPTDAVADSVLTVGGLRIAIKSLNRLQANGTLSSETARLEARQLAAVMRATLDDSVLAPAPAARRTNRRAPAAATPPRPQRTTPAETPPATDNDPFRRLRQSGNN